MLPRRRFRRSRHGRILNLALAALAALFFLDVLTLLKHYRIFSQNLLTHIHTDRTTLPAPVRDQKIFIATQVWTNAEVVYYRWGDALMDMIEALGPDNVFLSIYESGSLDNTKDMLHYLEWQMWERFPTLRKDITMENTTHEDEINMTAYDGNGSPRQGWVLPPDETDGKKLRRIPFLAKLRNVALQPLLREQAEGRTYDKILFVNDVVFTPADVLTLLATNQGSYSSACALDFHSTPSMSLNLGSYYDTFVLRDSNRDPHLSLQFPYFRPSDSLTSMLLGHATRVTSCWNGMLFMDAAPFYSEAGTTSDLLPRPIDNTALGLPFRGIPDSLASHHLEGSECCLIHTDHFTLNPNHKGVYINPSVRVGYSTEAYNLVHLNAPPSSGPISTTDPTAVISDPADPIPTQHPNKHRPSTGQTFLTGTQYVLATYLHRLNRLRTPSAEKQLAKVHAKVEKWLKEEGTLSDRSRELGKYGEMCLIDEMHILMENGWRHA